MVPQTRGTAGRALLALGGGLALLACGQGRSTGPDATAPSADPGFLATPVDPRPPFDAALAARGRKLFLDDCAACHGVNGDGKGYGAPFLFPKPRDFTTGVYKIRTTPSGSLPRSSDIYRTITRGVSGTAMPALKSPMIAIAWRLKESRMHPLERCSMDRPRRSLVLPKQKTV